jgi:hypothetical protein
MHSWDITSSNAIVACLLLMVMVEVGSRQLIVGTRYLSVRKRTATSPSDISGRDHPTLNSAPTLPPG